MNFKGLIALLAIFVVLMSASAVCAEDAVPSDDVAEDDFGDIATDGDAEDGDDEDIDDIDDTGDTEDEEDVDVVPTEYDPNMEILLDSAAASGANDDGNANADGDETPLDDNATGNPILVLLAALAVLGVVKIKRD